MQRAGHAPLAPAPPCRLRWLWASGGPLDLRGLKDPRRVPTELLPDFCTARFKTCVQPVVQGGLAFLGSAEGDIFAIDVLTGETEWKPAASGPILHCATIDNGSVYVGTLNGVDAFDLGGKRRWTFRDPFLGHFWACPAVLEGVVLIGSDSGRFSGIKASTGEVQWQFDASAEFCQTSAAHGKAVYFGAEDMHAYSLWRRTVPSGSTGQDSR